jgi:tetratricopeptide (TPR) repeat protein
MKTRVCCAALLLAASSALLVSPPVRAQEKDAVTEMARRRFQEGVKFFDQKRYEEARGAFLQAFALKRHPALLLNLAQSEIRSGHPAEAARHFAAYLREAPNASQVERSEAEKGLREARAKLGRVQITAPPGAEVLVDGESVGQAPIGDPVDVTPGTHTIEARSGGKTASTSVSVLVSRLAAATVAFDTAPAPPPPPPVEPPPAAAAPPPAAPTPPPAEAEPAKEPEPPKEAEAPKEKEKEKEDPVAPSEERENFFTWVGHNDLAIVGLGAAGVGLGVFIGFGLAAQRADENVASVASQIRQEADNQRLTRTNVCAAPIQDGFDAACNVLSDNVDARDLDRTLATIGIVVGGLSAAATVTAYFLGSGSGGGGTRAQITPILGPKQTGLGVVGTF